MKNIKVYILGVGTLAFLVASYCLLNGLASRDVQAQNDCCTPPQQAPTAARFPQGAQVNVYIDANSGFTSTEQQAIIDGLQSWNGQSNNSNVTYNVTVTSNPPPSGTNNTIIVRYSKFTARVTPIWDDGLTTCFCFISSSPLFRTYSSSSSQMVNENAK
jgi:hypothetical protein